ncbi:MAG: hypothetical protein QG574_927 [Cyanobacteriota bacterium erpe_2018_sw_21hr_WHONDRS-SW48-000092_B_bin.40]|nr:hypothetical protein [Cyanobacteriota bacterium erpe_2018_sw_21hr_WHONDRS-SW48-000092_B_bin.40]
MPIIATTSRPLSVGDIIGRGFRIFRINLKLIAQVLLFPTILLCAGRIGFIIGLTHLSKGAANIAALPTWGLVALAGGLLLLIGGFVLYLRLLALVRVFTGFAPNYIEANKYAKTRLGALIGLTLAAFAASILVMLMFAVAIGISVALFAGKGVFLVAGVIGLTISICSGLLTLLFVSVVGHMALSSIAIEKDDLGTLISHALALSSRSFFRSILFYFLAASAVALLAYPLSLPLIIILVGHSVSQGIATGTHHSATELPIYMQIVSQVWEQLVSMIVTPISFTCFGLYYCDLRMRQEGLDLIERVDVMQAENNSELELQ